MDGPEVLRNEDTRYYTFNSSSILDELNDGSRNVFHLSEATPEPDSSIPSVIVRWTQADYLRVAQAVQQLIWQEPEGALELSQATFKMDCGDINQGTFSEVNLNFYRMIKETDSMTRIQYYIIITPSKNLIKTVRMEIDTNGSVIIPTDLKQYNITAEEALRIAEEKGGADIRGINDNPCMIVGILDGTDGWTIVYQQKDEISWEIVFRIVINAQTGSVRKTKP